MRKLNLIINGPAELKGRVRISAAKNSVLKLMAASVLIDEPVVIRQVPDIIDVRLMLELIAKLGKEVSWRDGEVELRGEVSGVTADYDFVSRMRASILVLGPLVGKHGRAVVALPGGCNIGHRKIDLHLRGLSLLGAEVTLERGYIEVRAEKGLKGTYIHLDIPSVGATENLLMAAVTARGETVIDNAAREPEVVDLARFLKKMGAEIEGEGTQRIRIAGGHPLRGGFSYLPIPDRIEAGTYITAALITGSRIKLENVNPEHLDFFLEKLSEADARLKKGKKSIEVQPVQQLTGIDIATFPYPGFPTDLQPQTMALLALARGVSVITENIFDNRFLHADELVRMGADIQVNGKHAIVRGVKRLYGVPVTAYDLRGGAALAVAALAAEGRTVVRDAQHIFRGYEDFAGKLRALGAEVELEEGEDEYV